MADSDPREEGPAMLRCAARAYLELAGSLAVASLTAREAAWGLSGEGEVDNAGIQEESDREFMRERSVTYAQKSEAAATCGLQLLDGPIGPVDAGNSEDIDPDVDVEALLNEYIGAIERSAARTEEIAVTVARGPLIAGEDRGSRLDHLRLAIRFLEAEAASFDALEP